MARGSRVLLEATRRGTCACALLLALSLALLATSPDAHAATLGGGSALSELTEGGQEAASPTKTSTTSNGSSEPSNSNTTLLLVTGAAIVLLCGIGYVIVRDARRVAPATDVELVEGTAARHSEARLAKRRAKAKAARQQRKRNR